MISPAATRAPRPTIEPATPIPVGAAAPAYLVDDEEEAALALDGGCAELCGGDGGLLLGGVTVLAELLADAELLGFDEEARPLLTALLEGRARDEYEDGLNLALQADAVTVTDTVCVTVEADDVVVSEVLDVLAAVANAAAASTSAVIFILTAEYCVDS